MASNNKKTSKTTLIKHFKEATLFKKIMYSGIGLFVLGIISILILTLSIRAGAFGKLPTYAELQAVQNPEASRIYSADEVIIGKYFIKNRTSIEYENISTHLTNALVATEDARFYKHTGIDLRAWARVGIKTVLMNDRSSGGGSTITQQLAKNLFPRKRFSVISIPVNKIREFIVARRIEKIYTKKEILNLYLNTVPFGGDIFGVQVASKQFFDTTPKDIKQEDAAVLIGMLKANTRYNPSRNPEASQKRRNVVLNQMAKYDYLTQEACDSLKALPLKSSYAREAVHTGTATYFREHMRHEIHKILKDKELDYNLYTDGLKIYTSLDSRLQNYAERAVATHMSSLQASYEKHWGGTNSSISNSDLLPFVRRSTRYKRLKNAGKNEAAILENFKKKTKMRVFDWKEEEKAVEMSPMDSVRYYVNLLNAGFLAVDPRTGDIRAWVGGISQKHLQYDHVKSKRPVGSTFKPILYATALTQNIPPCEYIHNRLVTYTEYEDWQPKNADEKYDGVYSLEGGLTNSVNTISVDLIMRTGIDPVIDMAKEMGIKNTIPKVPSIALGTAELTLYEMVNAYATLANMGKRPTLRYIKKIEDKNGEVIYEDLDSPESKYTHVLDTLTTQMMTRMLQSVVDNGTGRRLRFKYGYTLPIAGKTGTTQNHSDGYFIGYTPDIVAGVWVGGEIPKVRFKSLSLGGGSNMALPIFAEFMGASLKDKEFAAWNNNSFVEMPDSMRIMMDCQHYYDEMPVFVDAEEEEEATDFDEKLSDLIEKLKGKAKKEHETRTRTQKETYPAKKKKYPTKTQSTKRRKKELERSKAYDKAKKRREKFESKKKKKQKRKGVFDRVFGG